MIITINDRVHEDYYKRSKYIRIHAIVVTGTFLFYIIFFPHVRRPQIINTMNNYDHNTRLMITYNISGTPRHDRHLSPAYGVGYVCTALETTEEHRRDAVAMKIL